MVLVEVLLLNRRSSASLAEYPRDVIKTLYVTNGGPRGYWQAPEFCPTGTYASSFRIKAGACMIKGCFLKIILLQGRGSRGRGQGGNCPPPQLFVSMGWICLCPPLKFGNHYIGISTHLPPPQEKIVPAPLYPPFTLFQFCEVVIHHNNNSMNKE